MGERAKGSGWSREIAEPREKLEEPLQTTRYVISGRHSSVFQHPAKALFDVAREGHKCVTWELLLKHTAPEETWPISRDELHALFDDIDSDNDMCVTWKEVDSYEGWTA